LFAETNTRLLVIGADKNHLTEGSHFHGKQFALVNVDIKCQGDLQFYADKRTLVWVMFWAIDHFIVVCSVTWSLNGSEAGDFTDLTTFVV